MQHIIYNNSFTMHYGYIFTPLNILIIVSLSYPENLLTFKLQYLFLDLNNGCSVENRFRDFWNSSKLTAE
jgi:hypothetical protein